MRAVARKPAAAEPLHDGGNDRYGPMSVALNRRPAVQAQTALAGTLNAPVQRMIKGQEEEKKEEVTDPKTRLISEIGTQALGMGLTSLDNGEFISSPDISKDTDFLRNTAHVHLYRGETEVEEDSAELHGHVVWAKKGKLQNRQRFVIRATKEHTGWEAGEPEWTEFQEELKGVNSDSKSKLMELANITLPFLMTNALDMQFP